MKISLGGSFNIKNSKTGQPLTEVTLVHIMDHCQNKVVAAVCQEIVGRIVLWKGLDYDIMGNWTQDQAELQLVKVLTTRMVVR